MPDVIRHPDVVPAPVFTGTLDVLARLGLLRLPSVARLEFIPMKIGAGMTTFLEVISLWTDSC
jgi:hypothetical protein